MAWQLISNVKLKYATGLDGFFLAGKTKSREGQRQQDKVSKTSSLPIFPLARPTTSCRPRAMALS